MRAGSPCFHHPPFQVLNCINNNTVSISHDKLESKTKGARVWLVVSIYLACLSEQSGKSKALGWWSWWKTLLTSMHIIIHFPKGHYRFSFFSGVLRSYRVHRVSLLLEDGHTQLPQGRMGQPETRKIGWFDHPFEQSEALYYYSRRSELLWIPWGSWMVPLKKVVLSLKWQDL